MDRVYLDWNASAPLRPEARAAMVAALDVTGNPSSVHAEGRAARAIVERARAQVADAFGVGGGEVVFTSGATEAAALGLADRGLRGASVEHESVLAWIDADLPVSGEGAVTTDDPGCTALQAANSETGVVQDLPRGLGFVDAVQAAGKLPFAFDWTAAACAAISGHKFGGPRGIGALLLASGCDPMPRNLGGGQESGRRSGTENVAAIAGLGAAAEASARDLDDGLWERVEEIRNILESALEAGIPQTIFVGKDGARLPNTSCVVVPDWKSETQVMAMDLAGFSISSGSACSSGKVRRGRVLDAMGLSPDIAACAVRISLGPSTSETDVLRFADSLSAQHRRVRMRAA